MEFIKELDIPSSVRLSIPGVIFPGLDLIFWYASVKVCGSAIVLYKPVNLLLSSFIRFNFVLALTSKDLAPDAVE